LKNLLNELSEFIVKNAAFLLSLVIGVTGKLAIDSKNKKLTTKDIIIKVVLSIFVGYIVGSYLESHGMEKDMKIYVPVSTLLGESVVGWIIQNANKILNVVLDSLKSKVK